MLFLLPALELGIADSGDAIERSLAWVFGGNELGTGFYATAPFRAHRSVEREESCRGCDATLDRSSPAFTGANPNSAAVGSLSTANAVISPRLGALRLVEPLPRCRDRGRRGRAWVVRLNRPSACASSPLASPAVRYPARCRKERPNAVASGAIAVAVVRSVVDEIRDGEQAQELRGPSGQTRPALRDCSDLRRAGRTGPEREGREEVGRLLECRRDESPPVGRVTLRASWLSVETTSLQ